MFAPMPECSQPYERAAVELMRHAKKTGQDKAAFNYGLFLILPALKKALHG